MKLSYEWLKEYVKISEAPHLIAQGLTMSGSEVGETSTSGKDTIMELEITSNRPDCLSVIGLAREVSAVFNKDMTLPEVTFDEKTLSKKDASIECAITGKDLCPLYTAKIIRDVRVEETKGKIAAYLLSIGARTVNNIVDITNYCLIETGQPTHAFDLDKIKGDKIFVREASDGEKITTIDNVERKLKKGMLIIADKSGPIAIAGVMGGKDTEVTKKTKNILLESAYFDPLSVRRTARELALSTDSSYRFERGVDKEAIERTSHRVSELVLKNAGGKVKAFLRAGKINTKRTIINFRPEKAGQILGVDIQQGKAANIFSRLGMKVEKGIKDTLKVEVPPFRGDITREIDLVEEIARIYGYDNIPAAINKFVTQIERKEKPRLVTEKIKETLSSLGLNEIMSYSLISEASAERFRMISKEAITLVNPLSEEQKVLTPQLLDGMLKAMSWNRNRNNKDLKLFEIGKIYARSKDLFKETPVLCMAVTGVMRKNWKEGEKETDIYDLKGMIEMMFDRLNVQVGFKEGNIDGMLSAAHIELEQENIGFLTQVGSKILEAYDIDQKVYLCQIRLDKVTQKTVLKNKYSPIVKFPSSERDISVLCDESVLASSIMEIIQATGGEMIRTVRFKDMYVGKQIPEGKKSLTYSMEYGLKDGTITDEETEKIHSEIKGKLIKELNISFR
ncbi:MAG: phenylalanine--tRNA ligase subunit beta [Candidatus Omnitrophota bacterium]